jgi:hypothetical protein
MHPGLKKSGGDGPILGSEVAAWTRGIPYNDMPKTARALRRSDTAFLRWPVELIADNFLRVIIYFPLPAFVLEI